MGTDNVPIGDLIAQIVVEAKRLGYSEVSIWHDWMPRAWIVAKYYRKQGLCVYDSAVTDEFLQEIARRCEAEEVTWNYLKICDRLQGVSMNSYLTGTLYMDVTLHGTKYMLRSHNDRLVFPSMFLLSSTLSWGLLAYRDNHKIFELMPN